MSIHALPGLQAAATTAVVLLEFTLCIIAQWMFPRGTDRDVASALGTTNSLFYYSSSLHLIHLTCTTSLLRNSYFELLMPASVALWRHISRITRSAGSCMLIISSITCPHRDSHTRMTWNNNLDKTLEHAQTHSGES